MPPVYSDQDIPRFRRLFDECESHFRGLKALGVAENMYLTILVPAVMQKLPEFSADDHKRRGVFNLVDGENVASLFERAGTERIIFMQ